MNWKHETIKRNHDEQRRFEENLLKAALITNTILFGVFLSVVGVYIVMKNSARFTPSKCPEVKIQYKNNQKLLGID